MEDGVRAALAFASAFGVVLVSAPAAMRLAVATNFMDTPRDYKEHAAATPYLGGLAVVTAFLIAASIFGFAWDRYLAVTLLALGLCALGTIDDRLNLGAAVRVLAQLAAGAILWSEGLRWEFTGTVWLDFPITMLWVAGLANAFNLLDNIDGACATTASVSAAGIGAIALGEGDGALAAMAFALSGACACFLIFNLAQPSRIFLGDGGSVPIGFLIAAFALLIPQGLGHEALLAAVPLAGVAIFDTTLVALSRTRRGISLLTGGRDHSTHRLLRSIKTPRRVACVLAATQALLVGLSAVMMNLGEQAILAVAVGYVLAGVALLVAFEHPILAPRPAEQST